MNPVITEGNDEHVAVEGVTGELLADCGLPEGSNMSKCLRVINQRLITCPDVKSFHIKKENGVITSHTLSF